MRIKRVEIIGFKSFCDRAVVQIGESITGVVGPNGCGKSNIVDAIRWCMGEQSAKHLRGKAMEDVIFAGSDTRGPAPMAEVSLTFDDVGFKHETLELAKADETEAMLDAIPSDEDGEAPDVPPAEPPAQTGTTGTWLDKEGNPIASPVDEVQSLLEDKPPAFEFSHYTEVTITRRLYRDGISQYFINKTACRLRDITDFFLGTGVGTKAYAIIEQGRIGQIVSARPQDRRAIIEEAAGITKFKTKKKAAERKLDQTRQNLMRVSDIVGELDKRMGTLRRQAQKAERYRKYKSEMRDIELWKASHRWLELAGEASLVGGRLGDVRTELDTARTEYIVKDATVVAERADLVVEERRLVGVQETVYELDNKIRLGDSKIGFELREADELDHRIAGARAEIDEVAGQRERGKLELDARSTELAALEADVARESGEVRTREDAAADARGQLAGAEQMLESSRHELADHKTTIATAQAQLEALAHRRGEANGRLERVVAEGDAHAKSIKELEREGRRVDGALVQLRQTRLDLGSQGDDFVVRRERLADEVSRGEAEVETLRTELHRRRSRLVSLEEIQARYEGFARGTRAVMQGSFTDQAQQIRGVVADVVRAPELLEVAVEAALGDRLGGVLVADREVGVAAISYLKQEGGGRSAFVPMTIRARAGEPLEAARILPFEGVDSAAIDSEGVPRAVQDDRFGEPRFESAATKAVPFTPTPMSGIRTITPPAGVTPPLGVTGERITPSGGLASFEGEGNPAYASAVPEPVSDSWSAAAGSGARAEGSGGSAEGSATDVATGSGGVADVHGFAGEGNPGRGDSAAEPNTGWPLAVEQLGPEKIASLAAQLDALVERLSTPASAQSTDSLSALGWQADVELASIGAALRASSLAADAWLAAPAWYADVELAASGAALRSRSLAADAMLAATAHADVGASIGTVLQARSLATDAVLTFVWGDANADVDGPTYGSVAESLDDAWAVGTVAVALADAESEGLAAHVRAYVDLDPGLRADLELANLGAALRARSLFADAVLADPMIGEAKLFSIGHSLRARSLLADGRLAEAQLADAQLAAFHAAVATTDLQLADAVIADPLLADALLAALTDSQRIEVRGMGLELAAGVPSVEQDARVWALGAALRARSLLADAQLAGEIAARMQSEQSLPEEALPEHSRLVVEPVAPARDLKRPAFEFEDRSTLVGAMVEVARDQVSRSESGVSIGEGVLGRMIDLVGFADGFEQVGKRLLGKTVVVDHLRRAIDLYERGVSDRLVTLDGDIVDQDGVVAGGSREAQGSGVLAQKREIRDLHEIVGQLEHDLSEAMQRLVTAKTQLTQVTKAIDGLRAQVHEGEVAIVGHEKDDARVRGELERQRDRRGHLATEQHELETRIAGIAADETVNRDRRTTSEQRIGELEQLQLDGIALVASCREKLEELGKILTEARIRAAQLEAQRAAVESATLRLAQTDAELAGRAERLTAECDESGRRSAGLREGCDRLAAELALTREQRDAESRTLEDGRTAYQVRVDALSEIELAARDLRTRADALANELNQLELRHGQIAMTARMLCDQISERYQVELADALDEFHQRKQVSDAEDERLAELRELIDRMGTDINLTAIEEFADVSTRFEFLAAQKIDLERAVDQLQRAIDKINKTSRKLFKDTFAAVNATFKEVYPRLFRGGRAYLSLAVPQAAIGDEAGEGAPVKKTVSEDDMLEAGIEIFAQPPGKKNVTVDQLSGGEKALTAVALVFSIFLIKPSPFCILDEVDAPLDEANVDRYNEIVREMTDRSQFIVITHNKRTMEAADNLYGVTMQEPGVSKLVTVNLSRLAAGERPAKRTESTVSI